MTCPLDGDLVPETSVLLRLPRAPRDFDPAHWRPSYEDFQPSSADKDHAKSYSKPVRVSVWDHGLTTVGQAKGFRSAPALVVAVANRSVLELAQQMGHATLQTVYDPLTPPDNEKPGAPGHAGIEGLGKGTGLSKLQRRALLDDLARRATLLEPIIEP